MAVEPSCIIRESERLLESQDSEATYRTSVGRSYYASYHAALRLADQIRKPAVSELAGHVHENLRLYFQQTVHPDKSIRMSMMKIGYTLQRLHKCRVDADYNLKATVHKDDAISSLVTSKDCIAKILELDQVLKAA